MPGLIQELSRRNVIRAALAYAVTGWVIVQIVATVFPMMGLPEWAPRLVLVMLFLCFPFVLIFSWVYELTPKGLRKTEEVDLNASTTHQTARKLDIVTLAGVVLAIGATIWAGRVAPSAPVAAAQAPSIAVLPFRDLSQDQDQGYFADGLTEEVINGLARIDQLQIAGRTSSFSARREGMAPDDLAELLGVSYLLDGAVRKAGDRVRITVSLVDARNGFELWAESFDRRLASIFQVQDEIARAVAQNLEIKLLTDDSQTPTDVAANVQAFDVYLQARRLVKTRRQADLQQALGLLRQARERDPTFAPVYAEEAQVLLLLSDGPGSFGDTPLHEAEPAARALLDRALALDPKSGEALAVMGLLFSMLQDAGRAEHFFAQALQINPSLTEAHHWRNLNLWQQGHLIEAVETGREFARIDPLFLPHLGNLASNLAVAGEVDEAKLMAARLQRSFPDAVEGWLRQGMILYGEGSLAAARGVIDIALEKAPDDVRVSGAAEIIDFALGAFESVAQHSTGWLAGQALFGAGRLDEARAQAMGKVMESPYDTDMVEDLLQVYARARDWDAYLRFYDDRWDSPRVMQAEFGYYYAPGPLGFLCAALANAGRDDALAEALLVWRERVDFLRQHGWADPLTDLEEAMLLAREGDLAAAAAMLQRAIERGARPPLLAVNPAFDPLRGRPEFERALADLSARINADRASLGLPEMVALAY